MRLIQLLSIATFMLISCSEKTEPITDPRDYDGFTNYKRFVSQEPIQDEINFWKERLAKNDNDEASLIKLGALHSELFKTTGIVDHILLSDSLYNEVLRRSPDGTVEAYQSLAANAISQHKFQEARIYAEKALNLKDKKATSLLLIVDVSLELGDYARANEILRQFTNKNSFAYLIRKAKVMDHEGMLDSAIVYMEKAHQRIKGNRILAQWCMSNLGDMYGHAGRIRDAYKAYLEVLNNNPEDIYALKGISWIALSHDKNTKEARRIINSLAARKRMPEALLILAEIADMEGNNQEKLNHFNQFKSMVSEPAYKQMYLRYLALMEAEEFNNASEAVSIARDEITNRSTPQSYDLLAWSYYHQKRFKDALEVAKQHVEYQTFEPDALYHLGIIYHAIGNHEKAKYYLSEALQSEFELGPSITKKIKIELENL